MAVGAVHAEFAGMQFVRERHRLFGLVADPRVARQGVVVPAHRDQTDDRQQADARLANIPQAGELREEWLAGKQRVGLTAGASAPEVLVEEVLGAFAERYELAVETMSAVEETMFFPLPRPLRLPQSAA